MAVVVAFTDWLELLGLQVTIDELLAGQRTLTSARDDIEAAKITWPSVSQDFVSILDQLELTFFQDVADAIDLQRSFLEQFNASVEEVGPTFPIPNDRLLTRAEVDQIAGIRDGVLDVLSELRGRIEALVDEIQSLVDELNDLSSDIEEGDPFLGEDIQDTIDELEELQNALEGEGCLG